MAKSDAQKSNPSSGKGEAAITSLPKDELIPLGARLRGAYLLQQAGATLEVARQEGQALGALLPEGFMKATEEAVNAVESGLRDRVNLAEEAKDSTRAQNDTLRRAREWRRQVAALGRMAQRSGEEMPEGITVIGAGGRSVPMMLSSLQESVALLTQNRPKLERFPLFHSVFGEGESLVESLSTADAEQEAKRLKKLPESVRNYYAAKGRLYTALKIVNDAGRALYASDARSAGRFNLAILYRRHSGGSQTSVPAPSQTTAVEAKPL